MSGSYNRRFYPGDRVTHTTPAGNTWIGIFVEYVAIPHGACRCRFDPPVNFDNMDSGPATFLVMHYELHKNNVIPVMKQ